MKLGQFTATPKPIHLFHGSGFEQDELRPGFAHTGKVVSWDGYENNTYLYATTDRDSALTLGFSSAVEKKYGLTHTHIDNKSKTISLTFKGSKPTIEDLAKTKVYLYTLPMTSNWVKNNNPFNNIDTEYKTKDTITDIQSRIRVDVAELLSDFQVTLK